MTKKIITTFSLLIVLYFCSENATGPDDTFLPWPPKDIDTTSHNFTWQIDTLEFPGTFQILPKAIWGADTNDVWMVAHSDDWHARIWHWDGKIWSAYTESGLGTSPTDIIGFSKDDVWFCSIRTGDNPIIKTIQHWDGHSWNIIQHNIKEHILSVDGSSAQNLYFGLIDGRIAHYNGSEFKIIETGTSSQITDILFVTDNEVYAIGIKGDTITNSTHYWIYKLIENQVSIVNYYEDSAENEHLPFPDYDLASINDYIFGVNSRYVYYLKESNQWQVIFEPITKGAWVINGNDASNLFIAGYLGESIYHYNGSVWKNFLELKDIYFFGSSIQVFKNHVFICGYANNKAYVIRGRRWAH